MVTMKHGAKTKGVWESLHHLMTVMKDLSYEQVGRERYITSLPIVTVREIKISNVGNCQLKWNKTAYFFCYSFIKHSLTTYNIPGTVLGIWRWAGNVFFPWCTCKIIQKTSGRSLVAILWEMFPNTLLLEYNCITY